MEQMSIEQYKEPRHDITLGPVGAALYKPLKSIHHRFSGYSFEAVLGYAALGCYAGFTALYCSVALFSGFAIGGDAAGEVVGKYVAHSMSMVGHTLSGMPKFIGQYLLIKLVGSFSSSMLSEAGSAHMKILKLFWVKLIQTFEKNLTGLLRTLAILCVPLGVVIAVLKGIVHDVIPIWTLHASGIIWGPLLVYTMLRFGESVIGLTRDALMLAYTLCCYVKIRVSHNLLKPSMILVKTCNILMSLQGLLYRAHDRLYRFVASVCTVRSKTKQTLVQEDSLSPVSEQVNEKSKTEPAQNNNPLSVEKTGEEHTKSKKSKVQIGSGQDNMPAGGINYVNFYSFFYTQDSKADALPQPQHKHTSCVGQTSVDKKKEKEGVTSQNKDTSLNGSQGDSEKLARPEKNANGAGHAYVENLFGKNTARRIVGTGPVNEHGAHASNTRAKGKMEVEQRFGKAFTNYLWSGTTGL
ncbi:MAG: hypothetical protein VYC40_03575 [Pseudomonadota bacterium]|nr:hypothetical protein [Pseudomonadota bacterium]